MADKLIRLKLSGHHVDLPTDDLETDLKIAGIDLSPREIKLGEVGFSPLNDRGRELLAKCRITDSLATTNLACSMMAAPRETLRFYCPLTIHGYDEDTQYVKLSGRHLARHEERIRDALRNELRKNGPMTNHLDPPLRDKIASMEWDIEKIGCTVYGKITCELRAPLTEDEQFDLTEWIQGQNSDGLGEDFEQQPVFTDDGELYVSLWRDDPGYYVLPEDEFRAQVLGEHEQAAAAPATGIQHISLGELSGMTDREGLILQGCGGDPQEWLDGINEMFTEEGILRGGDQFRSASVFEHDGCTNILFPMDDVDLDVGKLAMWRLQSHGTFGGTWLSDYLPNRLGIGVDEDLAAMDGDEEVDEAQGFGGMEGMA